MNLKRTTRTPLHPEHPGVVELRPHREQRKRWSVVALEIVASILEEWLALGLLALLAAAARFLWQWMT